MAMARERYVEDVRLTLPPRYTSCNELSLPNARPDDVNQDADDLRDFA